MQSIQSNYYKDILICSDTNIEPEMLQDTIAIEVENEGMKVKTTAIAQLLIDNPSVNYCQKQLNGQPSPHQIKEVKAITSFGLTRCSKCFDETVDSGVQFFTNNQGGIDVDRTIFHFFRNKSESTKKRKQQKFKDCTLGNKCKRNDNKGGQLKGWPCHFNHVNGGKWFHDICLKGRGPKRKVMICQSIFQNYFTIDDLGTLYGEKCQKVGLPLCGQNGGYLGRDAVTLVEYHGSKHVECQ